MLLEKRSLAGSDAYFTVTNKTVWSVWDIDRAVSQGYQANPWVFRAIQIIVQQAASVPWVVFDEKMSPIWDHPLSKLFARPNDVYPAQRMMELMCWKTSRLRLSQWRCWKKLESLKSLKK